MTTAPQPSNTSRQEVRNGVTYLCGDYARVMTPAQILAEPANDNWQHPFPVIDPADWQGLAVPEREWWLDGLVPRRQVTLLSGDGGTGKSLLATQLGAAGALGCSSVGLKPAEGGTLYIGAEDEAEEFHRRLAAIVARMGRSLRDLRGRFSLVSLAGLDAVMAVPDKGGRMAPTHQFARLGEEIDGLRPDVVFLDTSADMFGGNEIDRSQVRQFIGLLRGAAIGYDTSIVLLSHPSLTGMQTGSGLSGSTAWNNSARSRLYLKADDKDPDVRSLQTVKSNYGPKGGSIKLRYVDGVFVADDGTFSDIGQDLEDALVRPVFLELLAALYRQGRDVSPSPSSTYAPTVMAAMPGNKGFNKRQFARVMENLFEDQTIKVIETGPASKRRKKILLTANDFGGTR